MSLAQGPVPGFACAVADSRVWGTNMAATKKNWEMGGAPVLDSCRSLVYTTINRMMVSAAGGALERRCGWGGTCGKDVNLLFWDAN